MSFADKAFKLATAKETFEVLCPWWDLVSSGSLQLLTVVALMALSIDVVTKFGTAVKCTPLNGTIGFGGSQQVFYVNNACFEFGVGEYSQYFGLAILFQVLLLVVIDSFWLNWGKTKSTLKEFNKMVLDVHSSPCRQELIDHVLKNTKEKSLDDYEGDDEVDGNRQIPTLSQVAKMQAPVTKCQAQEAIKLNEKIQKFVERHSKSKIIERAYKMRSAIRLCVSTLFIYGASKEILQDSFMFEFFCDLTSNPASDLHALPTPVHYCVNLNAPIYSMLIYAFAAITAVNWIAAVLALLAAYRLLDKRKLQRRLKRGGKKQNDESDDGDDRQDEKQIDITTQFLNVTIVNRSHPTYDTPIRYFVKRFRSQTDYHFLMLLLSQTSNSMHEQLKEYSTPEFHANLIEFMTDRDWGLDKLRHMLTGSASGEEKALKIVDTDLLIVPPAVRKLKRIEEINISSNNYLSDLRNLSNHIELKSLKVKGCNVKDLSCLMNLSNLRYLDISENDVSEIPTSIGSLRKLEHFNVKKNPIKILPYEILTMEGLSVLEVEEPILNLVDPEKKVFRREDHGVFRRIGGSAGSSRKSTIIAKDSPKGALIPKVAAFYEEKKEDRNSYSMA